jgi:hypothetical protein
VATAPHHQRLARTQRQDNLGTATLLRWLDETLLKGPGEALIGVLVEVLLNCCLPSALLVVASIVMITGFLLWHSLLLVSLVGVLATFLIGWERAVLRKRHHQGKRVSKQVLNQQGGKIIHWVGSRAEPKRSNPQSTGKACWHLG